jgi:hypothetical protein
MTLMMKFYKIKGMNLHIPDSMFLDFDVF